MVRESIGRQTRAPRASWQLSRAPGPSGEPKSEGHRGEMGPEGGRSGRTPGVSRALPPKGSVGTRKVGLGRVQAGKAGLPVCGPSQEGRPDVGFLEVPKQKRGKSRHLGSACGRGGKCSRWVAPPEPLPSPPPAHLLSTPSPCISFPPPAPPLPPSPPLSPGCKLSSGWLLTEITGSRDLRPWDVLQAAARASVCILAGTGHCLFLSSEQGVTCWDCP